MQLRLATLFTIVLAVLAATGCASISVQSGTATLRHNKPTMVYVTNFSAVHADWEVDRTGADLARFQRNLQAMLRTGLVKEITDKLVPAVGETRTGAHRGEKAWLLRGEFVTVKQGSRLLRGVFGFGAGGTKLETRVEVYDLAEDPTVPFLTFSTTGGSNAEPGAIAALTTDPLELAIGGVGGIAHGLTEDTARTSREITAELSDYMYRSGWIPEDQRIEPKRASDTDTW